MRPAYMPIAAAIAAGAGSWAFGWPCLSAEAALTIGGTVASIGATMLGFMLASLAVLASISHTHLVAMMRRTGHYQDLLASFFIGATLFLLCTVAGYAMLFGALNVWVVAAVAGFHVGALVSLLDVGRKFWLVLMNLRGT